MSRFKLRNMEEKDIEIIYKNLHKKFVNKYFENEALQIEFHNKKYLEIINSKNYIFHIFEENESNIFVALVSYKIKENIAEVAIYLNKNFREKNYSKDILRNSIEKFKSEKNFVKKLEAHILEENIASKKLFLAFDFKLIEKKNYEEIEYLNFIRDLK